MTADDWEDEKFEMKNYNQVVWFGTFQYSSNFSGFRIVNPKSNKIVKKPFTNVSYKVANKNTILNILKQIYNLIFF